MALFIWGDTMDSKLDPFNDQTRLKIFEKDKRGDEFRKVKDNDFVYGPYKFYKVVMG